MPQGVTLKRQKTKKQKKKVEFPLWHNRIISMAAASRTQVQSLAWHSGLKDLIELQLQLGSDPGPGTPYAAGGPKKGKVKNKKTKQWVNTNTDKAKVEGEGTITTGLVGNGKRGRRAS